MRKYINIGLGILLIALAVWLVNVMVLNNTRPDKAPVKIVKTVFVENVKNGEMLKYIGSVLMEKIRYMMVDLIFVINVLMIMHLIIS